MGLAVVENVQRGIVLVSFIHEDSLEIKADVPGSLKEEKAG